MFAVMVLKDCIDIKMGDSIMPVMIGDEALIGIIPVFKTKAKAEEYSRGTAQIVELQDIKK